MRIHFLALIGVAGYSLLAIYLLQEVHGLPWLGGVFAPAVLLAPIVFLLAREQRTSLEIASYSAAGLVGASAGYAITISAFPWTQEIPGMVLAFIIYPLPVLALTITVAILINARPEMDSAIKATKFNFWSGWLALVAVIVLAESYWFGFSVKACQGLIWGLYGIMESPLLLVFKPALWLILIAAFLCGCFLPRNVRFKRRLVLLLFAILCVGIAAAALAIAPASKSPCSAL